MVATMKIQLDKLNNATPLAINFEADFALQNFEVRVLCATDAHLCIKATRIKAV